MSLNSYFPEQFDELKAFFISGTEVVRQLKIDPEMRPMLIRALAGMDEEPDFPHALTSCAENFEEPVKYFEHLLSVARQSYEQNAQALADQQVSFPAPFDDDAPIKAPAKFTLYASAFANSLPDNYGSLVFMLNPEEVLDAKAFRKSILYLAEHTRSDWLKFLVLDSRTSPILDGLDKEHARIGVQTFYLSPEEMQRRAREDLQSPSALQPAERRQYKGLLASFAFSNKQYDDAAHLQREVAAEAEQAEQHGEAATAYYNLGNTLIAKGELSEANDVICKACDLCIEHKVTGLAPFAYVNLGVCLHRQKHFEEAFASLKVARDMYKAQNHRPGEAYVVDILAQMYALDGRKADAERCWRYCLSLYDGMSPAVFEEVRDAGRDDIVTKLKRIGVSVEVSHSENNPNQAGVAQS